MQEACQQRTVIGKAVHAELRAISFHAIVSSDKLFAVDNDQEKGF